MPNEMPLPARVQEIDSEIQTLRLMKDGLDSLTAVRNSLDPAIEALGKMKGDLKGETIDAVGGPKLGSDLNSLSFGDLVSLGADPKTGETTVKINTDKIDPLKLDKTQAPRNILNEAIDAQKALEELVNPFGESHSKLLKSMEKMAKGMDRSSELFGQFQDGITKMKKAWDLFDKALSGKKLEADELIEAFDGYFSGMLETFADTIGKVPGMGPFLEQYAKAIKSIVPDLKKISEATKLKNEVIRNVFGDAPPKEVVAEEGVKDVVAEQAVKLGERIEQLEAERWDLLDAHQKEEAKRAEKEVDQLEAVAGKSAMQKYGYTFDRIAELSLNTYIYLWAKLEPKLRKLKEEKPGAKETVELEAEVKEYRTKWLEFNRTHNDMKQARLDNLRALICKNPHILQNADLAELENRYPELEPEIARIRAGKPCGAIAAEAPKTAAAAVAVPVKKTFTGKVKATIAGGVAAVLAIGGFLVTRGSDCPEPGALVLASGVVAQVDPCPDQDVLIGDPEDDVVAGGDDELTGVGSTDELVGENDDLVSTGDEVVGEDDGNGETEVGDDGDVVEDDGDGETAVGDDVETVDPPEEPARPPSLIPGAEAVDLVLMDFFPDGPPGDPLVITDPIGGWIYSISGTPAGRMSPAADLVHVVRAPASDPLPSPLFEDLLGNTVYECGLDDGEMVVVCPEGDTAIPNEPLALVFMVLDTEVVGAEESGQGIWAYVADADGETANDWVPQGSFDWDYFQGTDTWFQLFHDFGTGSWSITASRVDSSQIIQPVELPVRAVIRGNTITFIVPESSIPLDAPYRVSAFVHDGTFQPEGSGGDVPGDDPTEPLLP